MATSFADHACISFSDWCELWNVNKVTLIQSTIYFLIQVNTKLLPIKSHVTHNMQTDGTNREAAYKTVEFQNIQGHSLEKTLYGGLLIVYKSSVLVLNIHYGERFYFDFHQAQFDDKIKNGNSYLYCF